VRVETKTIHTADVDDLLHHHNGAFKATNSSFYSNHITLAGPIATSFLKSKALLNTDWEK